MSSASQRHASVVERPTVHSHPGASSPVSGVGSPGPRSPEFLHSVLEDEDKRAALVKFCKAEHNEENILLWIAIADFKSTISRKELQMKADRIVATFIGGEAPLEVNLDAENTAKLAESVRTANVSIDMFASLMRAAEMQLSADTMPRFVKSEIWKELTGGSIRPARTRSASARPRLRLQRRSMSSKMLGSSVRKLFRGAPESPKPSPRVSLTGAQRGSTSSLSTLSSVSDDPLSDVAKTRRKNRFLGLSVRKKPSRSELEVQHKFALFLRCNVIKAGFLMKRGNHKKTWHRRWFSLAPELAGYSEDEFAELPIGYILPSEIRAVVPNLEDETGMHMTFGLRTEHRLYVLQACSTRDRRRWVQAWRAWAGLDPEESVAGASPRAGAAAGSGAGE